MGKRPHQHGTAAAIRRRVLSHGDRFWTYADFADLPATSVAKTLGRLVRDDQIQHVAKGLFYVPRATAFGASVPTGPDVIAHVNLGTIHPSGLSAANVLGLTTQNPGHGVFATTRTTPARVLKGARIFTRRAPSRASLDRREGALLEILRNSARDADVDDAALRHQLTRVLSAPGAFARVARAAMDEPPRVRAMLGALGESAGASRMHLRALRSSLNPHSRFDFGRLKSLANANDWQAA